MQRYAFDKTWFQKHQKGLLFLANAPIIKHWFRLVLRIHKDCSFKEKIIEITPNSYKVYLEENKYRADFRTHNKFSKRLFHSFYPLWWIFHQWDMLIANPFRPAWNLGFDTLTVFPDPNPETTSVDGDVGVNGQDSVLGTIRAASGNEANPSATVPSAYFLFASSTSNQYQRLYRWIFLFDTSALTAGATISAAVFSFYPNGKDNGLSGQASANSVSVLVASTPASNTDLVNGDYNQLGSVDFGRSAQQDGITTGSYNNITVNATGIADISKTGVTKYGVRVGWDFDNTTTGLTWSSGAKQGYDVNFAEVADTTTDPKLVVTYTSTIDYTLALDQGSFTLTGQTVTITKTLTMVLDYGAFVLTGIATGLSRGYTLVADFGAFVLSGQSVDFIKQLIISLAHGTFTLTGQAVTFTIGWLMTLETGFFTLTGQTIRILKNGSLEVITNLTKSATSSMTNLSKNVSIAANQAKSAVSSWVNQTKN